MEAVLEIDAMEAECTRDAEAVALRHQLHAMVEQMIWGGSRQFSLSLAPFKLTPQQYFTLVAISQLDGCTMSTLAARTHHSFGTMTGIIDRLVRQGLVVRQAHSTDRRVVIVRLTPEGHTMVAKIETMRTTHFDAVIDTIGELQARNLVRLLSQYVNAAGFAESDDSAVFA